MMKNIINLLISTVFSLTTFKFTNGENKYTNLDLTVIENIKSTLNSQSIVFVGSKEDLTLIQSTKRSIAYYTFVNSSTLEKILGNNVSQLNFIQCRTIFVTKEKLNLNLLLKKVAAPQYVSWLIFENRSLFPKLYIPVSNMVIFIQSTPEVVYANRVYHLKKGINETVNNLWTWDLKTLTSPPSPREILKENFHNVSYDMLVMNKRELCADVHNETLLKKIECVHQDFLELMGQRLKFSINVVECQEKEHPYTYPNGSDSELFLKLKHKEVDFSAVSHVIRTRSRRNYMEFVWPTFVLKSRMYLKQGRWIGRWATYLKPLQKSVWWGILLWIVATGVLIQVFEKLLVNKLKFDKSLTFDFVTSTLKALQVFCNQAIPDLPTSNSIRIIFALKFLVVIIFYQAYCGYLVSSLTVIVNRFPFKDLKGFFENDYYQIMTLKRGFHQFYIKKVLGEGQRENFMLPQEELPDTIQEALDQLCTRDYVAFTEFREDLLDFDFLKCKISELPSPIASLYVGMAMPKGTPLKEFLRRELLLLKSTGLVQRLRTRLTTRSDFGDKGLYNEFKTVSMTQIFSVFSMLGVGILFSYFILGIELMIERRRRLNKNSVRDFRNNSKQVSCRVYRSGSSSKII